jgi:drug/metabolite transporter (DMT)-like permease
LTQTALLLVVVSVCLHVSWNLISKRERPTPAFFLVSLATSTVLLLPVLVWNRADIEPTLMRIWPILLGTAFFSTVYNVALAGAYQAADLSLVYPLARSLAPAVVALASVALGRGGAISWGCWAGIVLIILGSMLLPLRSRQDLRLENYLGPGFLLALVTALGTAGYTLTDDAGVRLLRSSTELGPIGTGLFYGALHSWATTIGLTLYVCASRSGRQELRAVVGASASRAALVGAVSYASYILVLVAMTLVRDVSYVAAFRQLGVPLSVAAGGLLLGERFGAPRLAGAAVIFLGLILVAAR